MFAQIRNNRAQLILAMLSGLLLCLAFPKIDQGYLAWCALVPLLLALRGSDAREGFLLGFVGGVVFYLGLIYWTAYTMNVYGDVPLISSLGVLFLLAMILAVFMGLFGLGVCALCRRPWQLAIIGPAIWVLTEWLRGWLFTGFPWELLGHSQYDRLWVIQSADLFGVTGVSALIVLVNVVAVLTILRWAQKPWIGSEVPKSLVVRAGASAGALLLLTFAYGMYRIHITDQLATQAPSAQVAVIQGNVDQAHKWDAAFQMLTTVKYKKLSLEAAKKGVDLVVWPETATPFYMFYDQVLTDMVIGGIKEAKTDFIIGSPAADTSGKAYRYYNSAYLISARGDVIDKYDKVHLVPFGEYVPLKPWLPFLGKMVAEVGDFTPGRQGNTLQWKEFPIGMLVCYEVIFPDLARAMVQNGAQLLINITNDAWFGRTSAAYQHLSMSVFRCVENRRYMARAANTGISGFIDPCGRIMAQTPLYEDRALAAKVGFMTEKTLYTRWGDWPLVLLSLALMITMALMQFRTPKQAEDSKCPL